MIWASPLALALTVVAAGQLLARSTEATANHEGLATAAVADPSVEHGRELFLREWMEHDELSPGGDGLGPMFNARSCLACHRQGGVGGSGPKDTNVQVLCLVPPTDVTRIDRKKFVDDIRKIHPGFVASVRTASAQYHAASVRQRSSVREMARRAIDARRPTRRERSARRIKLQVYERRTPALFRAGLIDAIPDEVLAATAQHRQSATAS